MVQLMFFALHWHGCKSILVHGNFMEMSWVGFFEQCGHKKAYVIIDEVQKYIGMRVTNLIMAGESNQSVICFFYVYFGMHLNT